MQKKLSNDQKEQKVLERLKDMQQKRKNINLKRREKSAELLQKNHEKKAEQLNQLIQSKKIYLNQWRLVARDE